MRLRATHHALAPPVADNALADLRARPVEAVKWAAWHVEEELGAIRGQRRAETIKNIHWQAAGIGIRLEHKRRHRANQHRLGDPARHCARNIARNFTATRGMADMYRAVQGKMISERVDVGRIGVHLVAVIGLARTAMAAPVMRNDAIAVPEEKHHLRVPVVCAERPAMMEDDRPCIFRSPILEEDIDAVANSNEAHGLHLLH
jgi:hypothetical protein